MATRTPEAPSSQDPESDNKTVERNRRNKKIGYGVLGAVAAVGLAAGGYLFGSSGGDGKEVAAQPGNRPTAEATNGGQNAPAEQPRQPETSPTAIPEEDGVTRSEFGLIELTPEYLENGYEYHIGGEVYDNRDDALKAIELRFAAEPDLDNEELATAIVDRLNLWLNSGWAEEERNNNEIYQDPERPDKPTDEISVMTMDSIYNPLFREALVVPGSPAEAWADAMAEQANMAYSFHLTNQAEGKPDEVRAQYFFVDHIYTKPGRDWGNPEGYRIVEDMVLNYQARGENGYSIDEIPFYGPGENELNEDGTIDYYFDLQLVNNGDGTDTLKIYGVGPSATADAFLIGE